MPFSIRLRLDPVHDAASPEDAPFVVGVRLSFTTRGAALTNAKLDARVPAALTFVGRFTKTIRDRPAPEEAPLGELAGALSLRGKPPTVTFTCDASSLARFSEKPKPEEEQPDEKNPLFVPSALDLAFEPSFDGLEAMAGKVPRLRLPKNAGHFRYLEVFVRCEVQGTIEAELEQNDVLDVLIHRIAPKPYPFSL